MTTMTNRRLTLNHPPAQKKILNRKNGQNPTHVVGAVPETVAEAVTTVPETAAGVIGTEDEVETTGIVMTAEIATLIEMSSLVTIRMTAATRMTETKMIGGIGIRTTEIRTIEAIETRMTAEIGIVAEIADEETAGTATIGIVTAVIAIIGIVTAGVMTTEDGATITVVPAMTVQTTEMTIAATKSEMMPGMITVEMNGQIQAMDAETAIGTVAGTEIGIGRPERSGTPAYLLTNQRT